VKAASETETGAVAENIDAVKVWEEAALGHRSTSERFSDWMTRVIAGGPALLAHVVWFAFWLLANAEVIPGIKPFDKFPFPLLTTIVSLEAIVLSLLVLASQNRLTTQAEKRAELDLQIDLLAEREMTAVLTLLVDVAGHLGVSTSLGDDQITDLSRKTDIRKLTKALEDLPDTSTGQSG
jgi:uncharacterized membrane protein